MQLKRIQYLRFEIGSVVLLYWLLFRASVLLSKSFFIPDLEGKDNQVTFPWSTTHPDKSH